MMRKVAMTILLLLAALMLFGAVRGTLLPTAASAVTPAAEGAESTTSIFDLLYIFILAGFVGFEVISRVSPTPHTPLMAATNAISGISLVGSLIAAGGRYSRLGTILGVIAVTAATINVVGGFGITDRMLKMFHRKAPTS